MRIVCLILFALVCQTNSARAEDTNLATLAEKQQWSQFEKALNTQTVNQAQADGTTALHWAVFHRNVEAAKKLFEHKSSVDQKNTYLVSPLSLACELGHEKMAKLLIEQAADLESKRIGGETPILLAARNGNVNIVQALIDAGAQIDSKDKNGQTALMWAAAAGNLEATDALIKSGADIHHALERSGFTAFLFAARQGKTETVRRLLDAGVDVNSVLETTSSGGRKPRNGMSALLLAVESGHFELALKLVQWGADPNDQRSHYSALHAVTWVRRTKLGDNPAGDPAPRGSGSVHSLEFVRQLIQQGADVNLRLAEGKAGGKAQLNSKLATPFLFASQTADLPLMKLLLEQGADPTLNNADDCTPLMACAGVGAVAVGEEPCNEDEVNDAVRLLVNTCELDVNAIDKNGETAIHGAAYRNYPETVRLLTSLGAEPEVWNKKNKFRWSPFDIAKGKRPGSLKPSPETFAALQEAIQ